MLMIKKLLPLFALSILLASCTTSSLNNLTPTQLPRNATGLYQIEVALDSSQHTLRPDSIAPQVVVGFESYPMRPTLKVNNRWEALVPIAADKGSIDYHFKIDYEYNKFGKPGKGSLRSGEYKLAIK